MKRPSRRLALWIAVLLVGLTIGSGLFVLGVRRSGLPLREGEAQLTGLSARVTVRWDDYGVPHVSAAEQSDLFVALGYLHANDRLAQMELSRRAISGRLSEILGSATVEIDREARLLRLREAAESLWRSTGDESRRWLEAYSAGVNAWLDERGSDLPPTLRLLRVSPEPWTPTDSLSVVMLMGRQLSFWQGRPEELRFRWLGALGAERTRELIGGDEVHVPRNLESMAHSLVDEMNRPDRRLPIPMLGSNSWALGSSRSVDASAVVANDPHLALRLPGHWYQVQLRAPGLEAAGMTLPGTPAVVIGQTPHLAWALTNTMLDDQDLLIESVDEEGIGAPRVLRGDEWVRVTVTRETLPVRGSADVEIELLSTEAGPLLPEDLETGALARTLLWTGYLPADPLSAFRHLLSARTVDEVPAGIEGYVAPAQNLVVADRNGGLLYTVLGRLPSRRRGDGRLPYPGWDPSYGWNGLEPREHNPTVLAPAEDLLITANNDLRPEGFETQMTADFDLPARADRIRELLTRSDRWRVEEMAQVQTDTRSAYARRLIESTEDDYEGKALGAWEALVRWDGEMTVTGPPALFVLFERHLLSAVFADELDPWAVHAIHRRRWLLDLLEGRMNDIWFDRAQSRGRRERRRQILQGALTAAWHEGVERWGEDVATWPYGELHQLTLRHPLGAIPLLGRWVNRGPFRMSGSATTVAAFGGPWQGDDRSITYGPSMRWVAVPGDGDRGLAVLPAGQSGHPWDVHYDDQLALYLGGEMRPVAWSEEAIERATVSVLRLVPASEGMR